MIKKRRRPPPKQPFTPAALAAFKRMRVLENKCTCALLADQNELCPACEKWWEQHRKLHDELRCKPSDWPCVENPDAPPRYRKPDLEAQARWRALEEAVRG